MTQDTDSGEEVMASGPDKSVANIYESGIENVLKENDAVGDDNEHLPTETHPSGSSSTRIIETLHEKVDTLTSTNLQLTLQSHTLLEKLDHAQKREIKLNENISHYNHERDNLNSMLQRKKRKINELQGEIDELVQTFDSLQTSNSTLEKEIEENSALVDDYKEKTASLTRNYDTVLQAQDSYTSHFETEIQSLVEQIKAIKARQTLKLKCDYGPNHVIEDQLLKFKKLSINSTTPVSESRHSLIETILKQKAQQTLKQLDLPSWLTLFRVSENIAKEYAEKNGLDLEALDVKQVMSKENMDEIKTVESGLSQEEDTITIKKRQRQLPNSRTPSGGSPSTFGGQSPKVGGNSSIRSTFYGSSTIGKKPNSINTPSTPSVALPGVKRPGQGLNRAKPQGNGGTTTKPAIPIDQRRKRNSVTHN
ncbi:uncharacterized protein KNAG_0A07400 [Huiozyma naganishii CBS 8797]|uniref:SWI5-dependent HO expression protein 3 n=1 Tax=Huiozyma naganishii (strain ATCC MYA-139 / BCRC 22969 / CBS 8797 / KCTC 17520 / NBRC 10181 / NCYC 3082 / Yp74L-3) TaxID=1071383 RepID=J7RFS3_HUIN7|nr:hypothetical protein KNAG_0A07400 [Kazachstania naganishii CBS 8797]CCK68393.1 hypothetical protein KNAG_0A07400 [Kazachstania naganishii CBS 8797]